MPGLDLLPADSTLGGVNVALAQEQGAEQTDHHIDYFTCYLEMIDAGKASNHLVISTRPPD